MKFFIDTANIDEIREAAILGLLDGVTTNPSLVAKEGRDFHSELREIVSLVNGPISAEVTTTDPEEMLTQGRELARIHPNIVIKVPMTLEGLKTCKTFRNEGVAVVLVTHDVDLGKSADRVIALRRGKLVGGDGN